MAAMFTPGALGTVTPDPVDDTEDTTPEYGGLSALQSQLAVMRDKELANRQKSWDMVAQRLEKSRPSKAEMWFSLASALAQPTKTGSFGEVLGNTASALGESAKGRREYETKVADTMLQREQDLAELGSKYDLKGIELGIAANKAANKRRPTGFNPITGRLQYLDTGEYVNPADDIPQSKVVRIGGNDYVQNAKGGLDRVEPTIEAAAERAGAIDTAKEASKARVSLPKARLNAENAFKQVDQLLAHPGLSAVVGVPNPLKGGFGIAEVPGSAAAGFRTRLNQLKGGAFLEAYTTLKGGGAIANAEGEKAQAAVARMDTAQSEEEFRQAMLDYKAAVTAGLNAMEETAALGAQSPRSSGGERKIAPTAPAAKTLPPLTNFYKQGN